MGNKSVKQKNELLTGQAKRSQDIQDELRGFGQQDRGYNVDTRNFVTEQYKNLLSGMGQGGSGGGGGGGGYTPPAFTPQGYKALTPFTELKQLQSGALPTTELNYNDPRINEAIGGYRKFAETGGFTEPQAQDFRGRANSALPSFYEGLKTQLGAANRAAGGGIGFNSQMAKLAREQAYGGNRVAQETEANLQDQIRSNQFRGLEGVRGIDTELMDRGTSVEDKRNQEQLRRVDVGGKEQLRQESLGRENEERLRKNEVERREEELRMRAFEKEQEGARAAAEQQAAHWANANANRGRQSEEDDFRQRMAVLGEMRGLRGESGSDLPYYGMAGDYGQQATGNIAQRETEPGWADRLQSLAGTAIQAGVGAFMPTSGISSALGALGGKKKGQGGIYSGGNYVGE